MQPDSNHYFVYICGGEPDKNLQIGTAGNLQQHLQQMQPQNNPQSKKLVYYEHYDREAMALARERQIKESSPNDNYRLIESMNPNWLDLSDLL
jgi:putative endonuclease